MEYHYTYRITNIEQKKHYYGVRTCTLLPIHDLGKKYFSSSSDKLFLQEQKDAPHVFRYKIIRIFKTREEALLFEVKLHNKFDVDTNPNFYNKAKQTSSGFFYSNKGSTFSDEHREKLSIKNKNKSAETRLSISQKVKKDWETMSEQKRKEKCEAISNSLKGKPQPEWKNKKQSERMSGSKNSKAKIIHIYNNYNELIYECYGNFKSICIDNNLPFTSLRKSYVKNGIPIYKTKRSRIEAEKRGWLQYEGWYAIEI